MSGGKVYGRLNLPNGVSVPIRDRAVAEALERAMGMKAELADYRAAWQAQQERLNLLSRCRWTRLGRWLRLVPRPGSLTMAELSLISRDYAKDDAPQARSDAVAAPSGQNGAGVAPRATRGTRRPGRASERVRPGVPDVS